MSTAERVIHWYGRLVRLYPRGFQAAFGEELQDVFAQAVREGEDCGGQAAWACFLRELLDLPLNLLREYISGVKINLLVERVLTHKKHTRWRQAGAMAFALGFALLELLHGLVQMFQPGKPAFASWWGFFKATPGDFNESLGGMNSGPLPTDFAWLALSGLAVGLVISLAERGMQPARRVGSAVAGAAGLLAPYLVIGLMRYPFLTGVSGLGQAAQVAVNGLVLIALLILVGGMPAAALGLSAGARGVRQLAGLAGRGLGGLVFGLLAAGLVAIVLALLLGVPVVVIWRGPFPPWRWILAGDVGLAVIFGAVQGWVYGSVVGSKIGELAGQGR